MILTPKERSIIRIDQQAEQNGGLVGVVPKKRKRGSKNTASNNGANMKQVSDTTTIIIV